MYKKSRIIVSLAICLCAVSLVSYSAQLHAEKSINKRNAKKTVKRKKLRRSNQRAAKCKKEVFDFKSSYKEPAIKPLPSTFQYKDNRKLRVSKVDSTYLADLYLPIIGSEKKDHMRFRLQCDLNLKCKKSHKEMFNGDWRTKKKPPWDLNDQSVGIIYGGRTILSFIKEEGNTFSVKYIDLVNTRRQPRGMKVSCEI